MSKMKYSEVEWIGDIPDEWSLNKLRYIYNIKGGNGFSDEFQGNTIGDIPFCKCSDINGNSKYVYTAQNYVNYDIFKKNNYNLIPKNSLIFAKIGEAMKKNHRKINSVDCCIDNNIQALILKNNNFDNNYGYYFMKNIDMSDFDNGGPIPSINNTKLNNLIVTYPNIKEQKLIADFLDEKLSKLDNILFNLNKQVEILNKYKKQIITEVVTTGLNKNVEMKDSGIEWIGSVPKHWNIKLIKNICFLKGRIGWEGLTKDEYISEGPTLITGINFKDGSIDWDSCEHVSEWRFNQDKFIQIKTNDLLITKDGTVGKVALVNDCPKQVTLNSGVLLMRPLKNDYIQKYLYYVLSSNEFWHWFDIENIGNTTIIHLYQNRFSKFKIALPPLKEQKEIVDYLEKKCEQIDKIIDEKKKQVEKIEEYKKSVIYEYVTGKKRVKGAEELYG